jgi:glyoxylase-like metal-dependent hydrolase (beta-lactamase superfamily II)/ferredoxin
MANWDKRLPENVQGEFFVDSTCIDCDTCRQLAPDVFGETGDYSFVRAQPHDPHTVREALQALLSCPTGSIGTQHANRAKDVLADFPLSVEDEVFYCGFNSAKSFGGNSYFIRRPEGNWLVDSPKFLPRLARRFEEWGGIAGIFLTHQDDVADAAQYARHFGARRVIHQLELSSQPDAEWVLEGFEPQSLTDDLLVIPTPGHTAGHCALLYRGRFLFTGDHLWWNRELQRLGASRSYCWHSWPEQIESLARLQEFQFEWILPGHGQRVYLPAERMHAAMRELVERVSR